MVLFFLPVLVEVAREMFREFIIELCLEPTDDLPLAVFR